MKRDCCQPPLKTDLFYFLVNGALINSIPWYNVILDCTTICSNINICEFTSSSTIKCSTCLDDSFSDSTISFFGALLSKIKAMSSIATFEFGIFIIVCLHPLFLAIVSENCRRFQLFLRYSPSQFTSILSILFHLMLLVKGGSDSKLRMIHYQATQTFREVENYVLRFSHHKRHYSRQDWEAKPQDNRDFFIES